MHLRARVAAAILIAAAAAAPAPAAARAAALSPDGWREGQVVAAGGSPLLVATTGGVDVVAPLAAAALGGVPDVKKLRRGDRVRYHVARISVAQVALADRLELLPVLSAEPDRMVSAADLDGLPEAGGAVAVDARDEGAYEAEHLPGARSLPSSSPAALAAQLPADRQTLLVLYGDDEHSPVPFAAARAALAGGWTNVKILRGGLRAWRDRGFPTWVSPRHLVRQPRGARVLDVRAREDVARGTIPGAVAIPLAELTAAHVSGAPWLPPMVLVGTNRGDGAALEAAARIRRWRSGDEISSVQPVRVLEGGFEGWIAAGGKPAGADTLSAPGQLLRLDAPGIVEASEFRAAWNAGGGGKLLLDVRPSDADTPSFARHVPLEALADRLAELPRDREILVFCAIGQRSSTAREILVRNGFSARYLRDRPPAGPAQ